MRIAIISSRYPSENNPYNHMFVHMRCVEMQNKGQNVQVYVPSNITKSYIYNGVSVNLLSSLEIIKEIKNYSILYLHLLNIYPFSKANGWHIYKHILNNNIPFAMYVHGSEVQKYRARMFEFNYQIKDVLRWFKKDVLVIPKMKQFVRKTMNRDNASFVFPSVWMKNDLEKNLEVNIQDYYIIPNGIDIELFKFHNLYDNRYKLLSLRPLSSKKYAVDIAIEIMRYLPSNFSLDIYGKGHYEKEYKKQIDKLNLTDRVFIKNKFINRSDLNSFFSEYGMFLAPTRMDAQGVSMCEAMASGLLTISSNNTAIPEFIVDSQNGILGNEPKAIAKKILNVVEFRTKYDKITEEARATMINISVEKTVSKELKLLKKVSKFNEK